MQEFVFLLNNGEIFIGSEEDLKREGYTLADVDDISFEFDSPTDHIEENWYNSFKH